MMNLHRIVRRGRSLLNLDREYALRRLVNRMIPVSAAASPSSSIFHVCLPKTASQFVRLVLSDPEVYHHCGKMPYPRMAALDLHFIQENYRRNCMFLNVACDYEEIAQYLGGNRSFFVFREPRELFVSWYISQKYTHPENPSVVAFRERSYGKSDLASMRLLLEEYEIIARIIRSWKGVCREDLLFCDFRSIVGPECTREWERIFEFLRIEMSPAQIRRVLDRYTRLLMTAGDGSKYNFDKRVMQRIFTDEVEEEWMNAYGDLCE
jgi:hypothetical protein